jgi:hypothetical protein
MAKAASPAAALSVLGVAEDREAAARAVTTWNAAELEEAIIAAKGAGGMAAPACASCTVRSQTHVGPARPARPG